jgi:NADH-quinone oxidoreductase subunit L
MTVPLCILAILALFFGAFTSGTFRHFVSGTFSNNFVNMDIGALAGLGHYEIVAGHVSMPLLVTWMPVIVAVIGLLIAYFVYYKKVIDMSNIVTRDNPVYKLLYNRYYQNTIFTEFIAVKVVYEGFAMASYYIDRGFDWIIHIISAIIFEASDIFRKIQTGVVRQYATVVVAGVSLLLILVKLVMEVI